MQQPNVFRRTSVLLGIAASLGLVGVTLSNAGCFNIGGDEPLVRVGDRNEPPPVDTSRVQVTSIEDARQQIAENHARIQYLERENQKLRADKEELKDDVRRAKQERDSYKDRWEKATGQDD